MNRLRNILTAMAVVAAMAAAAQFPNVVNPEIPAKVTFAGNTVSLDRDDMYERLAQIVQQGQSSGESGWKAFEDKRNRSAVLSAFTDPSTSVLRRMLYDYHRLGLDEMALSPDKGRAKITDSLDGLTTVMDVDGMSVGLSMFKDAKLDELVNIYTKASQTERDKVVEILTPIYPTEMKRINMIKAGTNKEQ